MSVLTTKRQRGKGLKELDRRNAPMVRSPTRG
jgi:hypothetical protein